MNASPLVLVTGASGFVGQALCRSLVHKGLGVRALLRRTWVDCPGQSAIADFSDEGSILPHLLGVDCVVHLAGRAHKLNDSSADPLTLFRDANVEFSLRMARLSIESGVRRFIFISSIGVNGQSTQGVAFDEHSAPAPRSDYAVSKYEAELALIDAFKGSDTELTIIRPPLVYASHAPGNFARLLKLVRSRIPLPFRGVRNARSIIALDNLVDFIACCIAHPLAGGETFLVSDGPDITTADLCSTLANGMGLGPTFFYVPRWMIYLGAVLLNKKALYIQLFCSLEVNSSKATHLLGWRPVVNTDQALIQVGRAYVTDANHGAARAGRS